MTRTIFPALLDKFERRLLAQLSHESGCSRSAVIRTLIVKEVASQRLKHEPAKETVRGSTRRTR